MMFLACERFGLGLRSGLGLEIGLVLGDRLRVRFEVMVRSIVFICTTVIENVNRKWLPRGIFKDYRASKARKIDNSLSRS